MANELRKASGQPEEEILNYTCPKIIIARQADIDKIPFKYYDEGVITTLSQVVL